MQHLKMLPSIILFFIFFQISIAGATPAITILSPQNQTYYNTNQILVNITEVEASPEMMWYLFPNEEWTTSQYNLQRTGYTANFNPPVLAKIWNFTTDFRVGGWPIVSNGIIYVGTDNSSVYAFFLNGTVKWKFENPRASGSNSPQITLDNGILYFGSGSPDSNIYALYANNGAVKWNYSTGNSVLAPPAVYGDTVYAGSYDNNLYALYTNNGTLKWTSAATSWMISPISISNGVAFEGSADGYMYAIYANNGTQKWSFATGNRIYSGAAISDGAVYFASRDHKLYAAYEGNGTKIWEYDTGYDLQAPLAILNDTIYLSLANANYLFAVYKGNGTQKWNATLAGNTVRSVAIAGDTLYLGDYGGNTFYALYLNGTTKYSYAAPAGYYSIPSISGGVVYIGCHDYSLYAFGDGSSTNSLQRTITLPYGTHQIEVLSRDTSGNYTTSTVYFTMTYDATPPAITLYSPNNATFSFTPVSLSVSANEIIDTWQYSLNGGTNTTFTPNSTVAATEGSNKIIVYANDSAGNLASITQYFSIDTSKPSMTVYSPANGNNYTTTDISLQVSANKTISAWWYSLNGGANTTFTPNTTITASQGANTLRIYANDTLGNLNSVTRTFNVDSVAPTITLYSPKNQIYSSSSVPLQASANETIATWKYSLNGGANVTFTPNTTITAVSGSNTIRVYANDTFGNLNSASISFTFTPPPPPIINTSSLPLGVAMGVIVSAMVILNILSTFALLRDEGLSVESARKFLVIMATSVIVVVFVATLL